MKARIKRRGKLQPSAVGESGGARLALVVTVVILGLVLIVYRVARPGLGASDTEEITAETHRSYQQSTMVDMRDIATANGRMRVAMGHYAETLGELAANGYMEEVPTNDGWGNPLVYSAEAATFTLISYGSDGDPGPDPPTQWMFEPYEVDIVMVDSLFTQGPRGQ